MKEWFSNLSRLFQFQQTEEGLFTKKNIITMLIVGIVIVTIPVAYRLLQTNQIFHSRAAGEVVTFVGDNIGKDDDGNITTSTDTVAIELRSPLGPPSKITPTPSETTPTPSGTITVTPTGTQPPSNGAPSVSSVTINNTNQCISTNQGTNSNVIKISWTNDSVPVKWVMISKVNPFNPTTGYYRKQITGGTPNAADSVRGPSGFVGFNGSVKGQNLVVKPGETIYIRLGIGDQNPGSVYTFTAKKC